MGVGPSTGGWSSLSSTNHFGEVLGGAGPLNEIFEMKLVDNHRRGLAISGLVSKLRGQRQEHLP